MPNRILSLIFFLCFSIVSTAQNTRVVLKFADERYNKGDFFGADPIYKKALEIDSSDAEILYKYGRNLTRINDFKRASTYLFKAYILDRGRTFIELPFELAESYRSIGKYREARKYYNYALRPYQRNRKSLMYKKITQRKKSTSWAKKYKNSTSNTPTNLGKLFNGEFTEFAATYYKNNLYFSALIPDSSIGNNRILDKEYFSKLYGTKAGRNSAPKPLSFDNKSFDIIKNKHVANPSFFNEDIYFSLCDTTFNCEIWKGHFSDGIISNLTKLNNNINKGISNTHPQMVEINGQPTLFFVSNRENGFGGLDIWKANLSSLGFDEAINLGKQINTLGDEITPFFSPKSQELYFSSDWHYGYGGFDIFKSSFLNGTYSPAENLKKGINSPANDYYFKPYTEEALLTSNRKDINIEKNNACCNDLYKVDYKTKKVILETDTTVNEEILNKYLPLTLYFHNDTPDPKSKLETTTSDYKQLANEYELLKATYIKKLTSISEETQKDDITFELEEFFDKELVNGMVHLEEFSPTLLKELEKGNKVTLTIKGYASSLANSEYNLNLTLRRIESLINFFRYTENKQFIPYLNGTADNGGHLIFEKIPYGEFAVESDIDNKNKIKAIYSLKAIKERKIELLAISSTASNSILNLTEFPEVKVQNEIIDIGNIQVKTQEKYTFKLSNTGKGVLKIYNISSNLSGLTVDFPSTIAPEETASISYSLPQNIDSKFHIKLIIVSNAKENLKEVTIMGKATK